MNKLTKDMFDAGRGSERYISYIPNGGFRGQFIARFKHVSAGACANDYVKHICKLIAKDELEEALALPESTASISSMLKARGWIHYNVRKAAKALGVTPQYLNDNPGYAFDRFRKAA